MSSLLKNSELTLEKADKIVSETLNNCDDGELYVEDTKSETIVLDDNKIKSSNYTSDLGYGFRAVTGDTVAYSHSNEISEKSLKNSSDNLKSTLKNNSGTYNSEIKKTNQKLYKDIDPIESKSMKSKIELLNNMNEYARSKDSSVKQVTASLLAEKKNIEIIRSGGELLSDNRPLVRINMSVMVEKNGRKETGVYGIGGRQDYDEYLKNDNWKKVCDEAFRIANTNIESKPSPAGEMKVVLGPGWPAILIHEAVGHGLEGDFNRKKTSAFHDLVGKKVASKGVTIIDDGTIDAITSDHTPHDQDAKRLPFAQAAFGGIGLETLLPLSLSLFKNNLLKLEELMPLITLNPAKILGLEIGSLAEKSDADLIVFDPKQSWKVDIENFFSKSKNSPFDGMLVEGKNVMTFIRGRLVYKLR